MHVLYDVVAQEYVDKYTFQPYMEKLLKLLHVPAEDLPPSMKHLGRPGYDTDIFKRMYCHLTGYLAMRDNKNTRGFATNHEETAYTA